MMTIIIDLNEHCTTYMTLTVIATIPTRCDTSWRFIAPAMQVLVTSNFFVGIINYLSRAISKIMKLFGEIPVCVSARNMIPDTEKKKFMKITII